MEFPKSEEHVLSLENLPFGWMSIIEGVVYAMVAVSCMKTPSTASIGFPQPPIRQKSVKEARKGSSIGC